jgi:hypothetical protein
LVQTYTTTSTSFIERTNDVSVVPDDVIEWRHKKDLAGVYTSTISAINVGAVDPYVEQPAYRKLSEGLT